MDDPVIIAPPNTIPGAPDKSGKSSIMRSSVPVIGTVPQSLPPGKINYRAMRKRWWLFWLVDQIVRHWPVFRARKGVFVPRLDGIGDIAMFLPALAHYSEVFGVPPEDITILSLPYWHSLAGNLFKGYRLVPYDGGRFEKNPWYRFKMGLWIRRQNFAVAVLDVFFRKALVLDAMIWISGAPKAYVSKPWISPRTQSEHAYYLGRHSYIDTGVYPTHELYRHFTFLSAVTGRTIEPSMPHLPWPKGRSKLPRDKKCVVVHFGCNEPGRRWPFSNYVVLINKLLDDGYTVVLTGTEKESDDLYAHPEILERDGIINLVCQTTLPEALDIIADAHAVVSNETGPAHMAVMLGTPAVIVIGGGHFGNFVPYPPELCPPNIHWIYEPMDCYHCFYNCTKRLVDRTPFPCFAAVPFDTVWERLTSIL
ncbi:glycosyltransferase family 9 protein [Telmatospirillum siberiense]|nr:glycosyltransferase family 9 protein [Telmatospirillum siberiense]